MIERDNATKIDFWQQLMNFNAGNKNESALAKISG